MKPSRKHRVLRILSLLLVAMQLLAVIPIASAAEADGISERTVFKTTPGAMTLDGKISDGEAWGEVGWSSGFRQIGADAVPEGSSIRFKTLWAEDGTNAYLYFLIDVNDTTLDSTGRAWNKDNVRVYVDEDGIGQDSDKVQLNKENYGELYASSEFMSYVEHSNTAAGFAYKTEKKAGDAGYVIEVQYTFQNATRAKAGAKVRANLAAVFGNAGNGAQFIWSFDAAKWSGGLKDKDYLGHAGELTLSDRSVSVTPESMTVFQTDAAAMTLDGQLTKGEAWDLVDWSCKNFKQIGSNKVPEGSDIRFKAMWAATGEKAYLWFLIDVNDNDLNATGRAWNQDNVRLFLDEDGVCEDNKKPERNSDSYGSVYASSEFMSYAPNNMSSKGFEYKATKKEDNSGYYLEVRYTYQNAALAVADATVRAQLAAVFADSKNEDCAQFIWSWDAKKWSGGLNDKEYFAHSGTLKLSATKVVSEDEKPQPPAPAVSVSAKQTTVDSIKIDGKVNDSDVWDQVEWSQDAMPYQKTGIATEGDPAYDASYKDFGFRFKTLWAKDGTNAYIYFLIDVNDSHMTSTKRAWGSDNVRVFLDETGNAESGTVAKRNREGAYASSEFMSYATTENSIGYKYRVSQKKDGTGYYVEVQYTLADPALAAAGAKMKLNVVANDADSTNDDGNHYAQQFAWSWNSSIWDVYTQIDCIEHAGTLTLSEELVKLEEKPTEEVTDAPTQPSGGEETSGKPAGTDETGTDEVPEVNVSCKSSIGFGTVALLSLSFAGLTLIRRKKED